LFFKLDSIEQEKVEGKLIQRLSNEFPNDIGIFCVFFMQHFTLQPGQAVFLPANEPHAYLYGGKHFIQHIMYKSYKS